MKKTIVFALTLLLLIGCRHNRVVFPRLVELDSLIAIAPDSAAALLEAIPSDSLFDTEDRAYHALLLSQARYKAYIPATSDSAINIAVDYYVADNKGSYDCRIRSLIYKGCVMTELNLPDSAVYWFKAAEATASPDDHANLGYILFRIGDLYQYEFVASNLAMAYYQRALPHLKESGLSFYEMASLSELASLSSLANEYTDWHYMIPAMTKSLSQNDMNYISANLATLGMNYYYNNKDYDRTIELLSKEFNMPVSIATRSRCHLILAQAFAAKGDVDSAKKHLDKCIINSVIDSMHYYRASAIIDYAIGDIASYYEHDQVADDMAHNILIASEAAKLKDTEERYILQLSENEKQINSMKVKQMALTILAAIALIVFYLLICRYKIKSENEAIATLRENLKTHRFHSLEQVEMSEKMRESMTKQQALLQKMMSLYEQNLPDEKFLPQIKKLLKGYKPEAGFWQDTYQYVNLHFSNILIRLKENYPKFTEPYAKVLALVCCGCSNADIMVITGLGSLGVVRNYKSKITHEIMGEEITIEELIERYRERNIAKFVQVERNAKMLSVAERSLIYPNPPQKP